MMVLTGLCDPEMKREYGAAPYANSVTAPATVGGVQASKRHWIDRVWEGEASHTPQVRRPAILILTQTGRGVPEGGQDGFFGLRR